MFPPSMPRPPMPPPPMVPACFPPLPPQPPPLLMQPLRPPVPPSLLNLLSFPPSSPNPICNGDALQRHLESLRENLDLLSSMRRELELIASLKESGSCIGDGGDGELVQFNEEIGRKKVSLGVQEELSIEAARSLHATLKKQLDELSMISGDSGSWEDRSEVVRLTQKLQKYRRNKKWRKRKRREVAGMLRKECEMYDKVDKETDEWRAREIAKDSAQRKMEQMKEIAEVKANEERKKLESELELVLVVEKLQELRNIRIQKLKKQGHFLPEEDDRFLERVQAAVEEEERQAAAAADTDAAKDAIASAEESRKTAQGVGVGTNSADGNKNEAKAGDASNNIHDKEKSSQSSHQDPERKSESQVHGSIYEAVSNLPLEFYHYYHGSNYDMGTLIEVRRTWDAYIRPGGSRIPGHWVQPPPPADEVWASYLVNPPELASQSKR